MCDFANEKVTGAGSVAQEQADGANPRPVERMVSEGKCPSENAHGPSARTALVAQQERHDYLPISEYVPSLLCPHSIEMYYREKMLLLQNKAKLALDLWQQHGCPELREPTGENLAGENLLEYACDEMIRVCNSANDQAQRRGENQ